METTDTELKKKPDSDKKMSSAFKLVESTQLVRAFYAIKLNQETRDYMIKVIENLQQRDWSQFVRWTAEENLHITLRFLGNISYKDLTAINETLENRLRAFEPFSIDFKEPRLFPHFRKPKVVAALIPANDALLALAQQVEQAAVDVGLEPETRQFKGHLTLGRCHKAFPKRIKIESMDPSPALPVNAISLYQSILSESGPTYIELKTIELNPTEPKTPPLSSD